ncbi:MAG: glucosamine-6-phosphate deaminase [Ruminococcaceae bacterium]|nr:glucosamine-6-phosphate deaminase [Oscillospiraceae bacterium]
MKVIVCNNYDELSMEAAKIMAATIKEKPDGVLGLATGSTPIGMYDNLIEMYKNGELDFKDIKTFNLDEYYPLSADNDQSYHYFMNKQLFSGINVKEENIHILDGLSKDPEKECADFEKLIDEAGGIDIQVLGIGQNGHIGFNEPDDKLYANTHLTDLTENTIKANSRFFEKESDVPTKALTMGMGTILKAKKIIILANGKAKHKVVSELVQPMITTNNPATFLNAHADVTLICDKEAFEG